MNALPLSPYSLIFWHDFQINSESSEYNLSFTQRIEGEFNPEQFQHAMTRFLIDHPIFSSHIHLIDNQPFWQHLDHSAEITHYSDNTQLATLICAPFSLMQGPLYRILLQQITANKFVLTLVFHHILLDGNQFKNMVERISHYYNDPAYCCASDWQRIGDKNQELCQSANTLDDAASAHFWQQLHKVDAGDFTLPFTEERTMQAQTTNAIAEVRFSLDKAAWPQIAASSFRPFVLFSQVWGSLIARCAGQNALALFYPLAIRQAADLQWGAQINTSLMPVTLHPDTSLHALCLQAEHFMRQRDPHSGLAFSTLPTHKILQHSGCRNVQLSFAQTDLRNHRFTFAACVSTPLHDFYCDLGGSDLSLEYEETAGAYQFRLRFRHARFVDEQVSRCVDYFQRLLHAALDEPDTALLAFPLLSPQEHAHVLPEPAQALPLPYPTLAACFEHIAQRYPERPALRYCDTTLTYRQLEAYAATLAEQLHVLMQTLPGPPQRDIAPVAIYCEKGPEFIIAMLAILKAGQCYMPISVEAANDRTRYQLEHAAAPLILVQPHLQAQVAALIAPLAHPPAVLSIDLPALSLQNRQPTITPSRQSVAAVIFTSGTTGKPKGVVIEQHAVIALVTQTNYMQLTEQDACLFLASPVFDVATLEIWGALLNGGKLVIPQSTQGLASDVMAFRQLLQEEALTFVCITRTLFDTLYLLDKHLFDSVKTLLIGGEALSAALMTELCSRAQRPRQVINAYGPTECTTMSTWYAIPSDFAMSSVPIGQAVTGRELYILNEKGQLQPDGATGELFIGGVALAAGYLNNPQQTAASFIANPFRAGRLYKTGDQVKRLPDGNLVFCGRNDGQVKIRGHRIELSEIENAINRCQAIQQSAVVALPKSEGGQLAAWYVLKAGQTTSVQQLKDELSARLPGYMMPRYFTAISTIPLTLNGKLDYRLLSKPAAEKEADCSPPLSGAAAHLLELARSLLNDPSLSLQEHFYRAGGDSIQAIQLIAGLRKAGWSANLSDLDKYSTLADFVHHLNPIAASAPAIPLTEDVAYPVTALQAGLVTWSLMHPDDDAYFLQQLIEYRCPLQLPHYFTAWDLVRKRFPALRTRISWTEGTVCQRVVPWQPLGADGVTLIDISGCSPEAQQQQLTWFLQQQRAQPVNFTLPGTLTLTLFKLADDHYQLLKSEHHALSDGWSSSNTWQQLHAYYDMLVSGTVPQVVAEQAWIQMLHWQQENRDLCQQYWEQQAADFAAPNSIAWLLDKPHQAADLLQVREPQEFALTLDAPVLIPLKQACQQAGITLNALLQFAWHKLLQLYTQDTQTLVGTVLSGRNLPIDDITGSVGLFINTLPLSLCWQEQASVAEILQQIHHRIVAMNQHHGYALSDLQSGQQRLFQSLVVFENYPENLHNGGVSQHARSVAIIEKLDFPLVLVAFLRNDELTLSLRYDAALMSEARAAQLVGFVAHLMRAACAQPEQSHSALKLTAVPLAAEKAPVLPVSSLLLRFTQMVAQYPDNTALVWQQQRISYQQLDQAASALAWQLYQQITAEEPVIIMMEKQPQWLVAMLAIVKAGGCYLPVAVDTPAERIRLIAADAGVRQVITSAAQHAAVRALFRDHSTISVTGLAERVETGSQPGASPPQHPEAQAAAILYTSGTSGKPKGVVIEQAALVSLVVDADYIAIRPQDSFIFLANPAFDAASFEIWGALLNGAGLVIPANTAALIADAAQLKTTLIEHQITTLWLTRSLFDALYLADNQLFNSLRYLLVGGEALTPTLMKQLAAQSARPTAILNGYGPTECTTFTTVYAIPPDEKHPSIPLGSAINGRRIWILDSEGHPVPPGAPGELYVGGPGLARAYLNQPEQTAQRFIVHPALQCRLYRTGDRVRQLPDGNLDYLGRIDNQIKIRGFRIEPDEIVQTLLSLPGIQQAAVTVWHAGTHKQLVAWLVTMPAASPDLDEVRRALEARLPEYMVPASFNLLSQLPLTANGKLDEKALPAPASTPQHRHCAPRSALEQQLCTAWQKVLQQEQIGIHDNFFRIGGDSIQSILLVTELRKAGYRLDAAEIHRSPTVAKMALALEKQRVTVANEPQDWHGECPLLPIQQWFFQQDFAQPHHWNQAFMVRLPAGLRHEQLQNALQSLAQHHDMLRAHFRATTCGIQQWINAVDDFETPVLKELEGALLTPTQLAASLTSLQADFNYSQGPLWRAAVIRQYAGGGDRLWLAYHHLIIDAVSWRILAQDLQQAIETGDLNGGTSSYRCWAQAQTAYHDLHEDDLTWWEQVVAQAPATTSLAICAQPHQLSFSFSAGQTRQLLRNAGQAWNTTINDLLLAALAQALGHISDSSRHQIMLEGHGRESWDNQIDLAQTVGWFTTMFPVTLTTENDTAATIVATKEMLRQIPAKGIGYGIARQRNLLAAHALPAISFNYLGVLSRTQAAWSLETEHCGTTINNANENAFALMINGAVSDGQLTFFIDSQLSETKTQRFAHALQQALSDIITLCVAKAQHQPQLTASDYGTVPLSDERLARLQQQHPTMTAIFPATSLQQGMLYHTLANPTDDAYRVQQLMQYHCALDIERYIQAWQMAVQRFPILRTAFDWEEGVMLQIICGEARIPADNLQTIDLSALKDAEQQRQLHRLQQQDRQQPFALQQPATIRLWVVKHSDRRFSVLKSQHHVLCDGWSEPCVLSCVHHFYDRLLRGETPQVEEQQSWLDTLRYLERHKQKYVRYWQQEKARLIRANDLRCLAPALSTSATRDDFHAETCRLILNPQQVSLMRTCATQLGITLNALVQFAWHKLIQIYSQDEQTQVGTVVAGRDLPIAGIEESVGPYINTLPLTLNWQAEQRCADILLAIQQKIAELNSHSNISLTELQTDGHPLFHSLVVFENYPVAPPQQGLARAWKMEAAFEKLDYPLALLAWEDDGTLTLQLNFFRHALSQQQAEGYLAALQTILQQCVQNPDCLHESIVLVAPEALPQENASAASPHRLMTRFQHIVQHYPDNIALTCQARTLSYQALDQRSTHLAYRILATYRHHYDKALPSETPIALLMDKGDDFIIGMLAILKAGGSYVPVSTEYPSERIAFILADTATPLLLTQQQYRDLLPCSDRPVLLLDALPAPIDDSPVHPLPQVSEPDATGAIIFTSGTTGVPKGVPIAQQAIADLVVDNHYITITAEDALLFLSSPVFDAATFEIWGALLNGAKLVIPPSTHELASDTPRFRQLLQHEGISIMWVTRSLFDMLYLRERNLFNSLRYLLVGGEALSADIMQQLARQPERPRHILNGYGPTECTTFTTTYEITSADGGASIPIGQAIAGRQLYVLNALMKPVPAGALGELYVGGTGVSRGYLNRPDLTARHFVANPFATGVLYKTGDWVRYRADGQLEYVGRKDQQVKIRGFRVELEEIAAALNKQPGVHQSVVQLRDTDGQPKICAWCIMQPNHSFSASGLLNALELTLPDYMLPAALTEIDSLPVTVNGKLDSARLPAPEMQTTDCFCAPRTPLESTLAEVWQQVLNAAPVSVNANFFRIGGDSIQSILVTTALRKRGIQCTTRDIFAAKTIEQLARVIEQRPQQHEVMSEQGLLTGEFALMPVQHWFNQLQLANPHWFNQSFTLALPAGLPVDDLRHYLHQLLAQHDMLRTRFALNGTQLAHQCYFADSTDALALTTFDLATLTQPADLETHCTAWQQDFSLHQGPLYRFVYLHNSRDASAPMLFCAFHHLIVDAVSWRIIVGDLQSLYEGNPLEKKTTSYRQWQQYVANYATQHSTQQHYWLRQMAAQPDYWQQADRQAPRIQHTESLSENLTDKLLHRVHDVYHSEVNDFLLAALSRALQSWHGQTTSYITLEGHGRESMTDQYDVSRTVGWFTSLYPLCLDNHPDDIQNLRLIKEQLRAVPDKGLGYGALKFAAAQPPAGLQNHALPAISFNYLGQISSGQPRAWQILAQGRGQQNAAENPSQNVLDFTVSVVANALTIQVDSALPQAVVRQIVQRFVSTLDKLVAHCIAQQARGNSWFSPADFPQCKVTLTELDRLQHQFALETLYPTTDTQRELLYFNRINPDFQIDQNIIRIDGCFHAPMMMQAWQYAAKRYDVLRTGYSDRSYAGYPVAFVCKQVDFPVTLETWAEGDSAHIEQRLQHRMLAERNQPMPADRPTLMKVLLVRVSAIQHYMIQTFNHVLFDGWSLNNILTTLLEDYQQLVQGAAIHYQPLSFAAFPLWLHQLDQTAAKHFWSAYLHNAPVNQRLPCETLPPVDLMQEKRMRKFASALDRAQTAALQAFATRSGYTPNQITQLAWMQALADMLDSDDIVIGTTMSERPASIDDVAQLAGLFVASPVLRLQQVRHQPASALLADIARSQPDRQQHAFYELNHYDSRWKPTSPFGSLFVFESMPKARIGELPFTVTPLDNVSGSNHQTVLCLIPEADELHLSLFYDAGELSAQTIGRLCTRFIQRIEMLVQ